MLLGKFGVLLWSLFGLLLVSFYMSNFRAVLLARVREKDIQTAEDVVIRDKTVYMPDVLYYYLFQ